MNLVWNPLGNVSTLPWALNIDASGDSILNKLPSEISYENSISPLPWVSGVKLQVPLLLFVKVPSPEEIFKFKTDKSSSLTSEALAKRSDSLIIKVVLSLMEPRSTGPVTSGRILGS